ncbi:MAG: hypothetical protein KJ626_12915 [Verrucomicrobia bacterium]|nr:hypothetical protein [Verrucomicrobiota bacterium]
MSLKDLEFHKDVGETEIALKWIREGLEHPLTFIERAEAVRESLKKNRSDWIAVASGLLEVDAKEAAEKETSEFSVSIPESLDPRLVGILEEVLPELVVIGDAAKAALPAHRIDSGYVTASELGGILGAPDRPAVQNALAGAGVSRSMIQRVLADEKQIDPKPAAERFLSALSEVRLHAATKAFSDLEKANETLLNALASVRRWPDKIVTFESTAGLIVIGSPGNDIYDVEPFLLIDPGGDDEYLEPVASANGLKGRCIALSIDLAGNDVYRSGELLGPASALFGLSILTDLEGNDSYLCDYTGNAAALCGIALLDDRRGNDRYTGWAFSQGAAVSGAAMLNDEDGDDRYEVGLCGQAYAGVQGCAFLRDAGGSDQYVAGGREPDHERHDDRFLSLAQGFSIGMRPFAGGGAAALIDLSGDDTYTADVYGQGVSYWYSAGMLFDEDGDDSYEMYHYGQGAGIHLSFGLLSDAAGNDVYKGYALTQGCAHDYAVGVLLDRNGDDRYSADQHSQGRGMNNAIGMLIDIAGDDDYSAVQNDQSQGIGNDGGEREYGSLGLLLDLSGNDKYSSGAEDGARMLRPDFGIIYDVETDN